MRYLKSASISILILLSLAAISIGLFYLKQVTTWSLVLVLMIGLFSVNTVSSIVIFIQRRNLMSKLSWLLVINIFPFFGAAIFYIFGLRYSERKEYHEYISNDYIKADKKGDVELKKGDLLKEVSNMTTRDIYSANFLFFDFAGQAIQEMFDEMRKAKKFIHIHFYIVKPGEIYEEFKSILIKKASEGVQIRFIIDDFGRWGMPYHQINELQKAGVKIGIFGKVYFPFVGSENGYRTHRKMVIIDGEMVFTGGINIANEYASMNKNYGMWIDLQGKITGPFVISHSLLFLHDWDLVVNKKLEIEKYISKYTTGNSRATLVEDSPGNRESIMEFSLIKLINSAKEEIRIATPYFIPSIQIYESIKMALLSGTKVHIYIPGKPDKKIVYSVTKFNVNKLQKFGLVIHEMKNVLIHSKVGLFDNKHAYFGTSNIDVRSLYSNFEMLNIFQGESVKSINNIFEKYDQMSRIVSPGEYDESFFSEKMKRFFVNLLSPIM